MKIMYLISVEGNGIGGHYHSLKTTVEAMQELVECSIVVIGKAESPIINTLDLKIFNIIYPNSRPSNIYRILNDLSRTIKSELPDILHAFDSTSLFYTKIISHYYKIPHITTLCGGRSPDPVKFPRLGIYYYPIVKNIILYSIENVNYFKNNHDYNGSNIFFIPNRLTPLKQDYYLIGEIRDRLNPDAHIFLRIARFSKSHKSSMVQSIRLVKELNFINMSSQLIIVGTIGDINTYNDIMQLIDENILVLTDDKYTIEASKLIDVADVVIGTGRGFMEGASRKKIMLCPSDESDYPILAKPENIFKLFGTNFSIRSSYKANTNLEDLKQVLENEEVKNELQIYMCTFSKQYFEIETVKYKMIEIYQELQYDSTFYLLDTFTHLITIIYFYTPQSIRTIFAKLQRYR